MAVTSSALKLNAFINTTIIIVGIVSLLIIMKWIYDSTDHKVSRLSIIGIIVIIMNIICSVWLGILGNNSLFTFINDIYPFIDNHCLRAAKIAIIAHVICISTLQTFVLMRMYQIFQTLPAKYRLCGTPYKLIIVIILMTCFILVLSITIGMNDTFKFETLIAIDNNKYKQCKFEFLIKDPPKIWGMQIFRQLLGFQGLISIYIQYICIKKLYQYKKYSNNGYIYNDFNIPCLHHKTKRIKKMLCFPFIGIVLILCCGLIDKFCKYKLYEVWKIINSFYVVYVLNTYFTDKIEANDQYKNNNNNNNNNLSVHLFQDGHASNINIGNVCYNKYINKIRFDVDKPFINNARIIFVILDEILCIECISKLIAEYASTLYLQCIECQKLLGYIETYKDWGKHNATKVNMDEFDNIRYYMSIKTQSNSQHIGEREYEYDQDIDVLCVQCAVKYTQTLTLKHKHKRWKEVTILFFPTLQ